MSPAIKYTLGRIGLFIVIAAVLLPFGLNLFLVLMIALAASMLLSFLLLRRWRDELASQIDGRLSARRAEKQRLRAALDGTTSEDERVR